MHDSCPLTNELQTGLQISHSLQQTTMFTLDFQQELPLYFYHDVIVQNLQKEKNINSRKKKSELMWKESKTTATPVSLTA